MRWALVAVVLALAALADVTRAAAAAPAPGELQPNFYEVLKVTRASPQQVIAASFERLVAEANEIEDDETRNTRVLTLNAAFRALGNEGRRKKYDALIAAQAAAASERSARDSDRAREREDVRRLDNVALSSVCFHCGEIEAEGGTRLDWFICLVLCFLPLEPENALTVFIIGGVFACVGGCFTISRLLGCKPRGARRRLA